MSIKKYWRVFLFLLIIGAFSFLIYRQNRMKAIYIEKGDAVPSYVVEWNSYIADYFNKNGISVIVDGKEVESSSKDVYMNENKMLMVSENVVREVFDCAIFRTNDSEITVMKGEDELTFYLDSTEAIHNENLLAITSPPILMDDVVYLPIQAFERGLQYTLLWDSTAITAILSSGGTSSSLPFAYDFREQNRAVSAKDQGLYGTCWAFAALTALETSLMPEEEVDFSEDHMSLSTAFAREGELGGDYTMATAYLTSWDGPVYEEDDPYGDGRREELPAVRHVQEVRFPTAKDYATIKKMVFQYGGVQSSIYLSIDPVTMDSYYYNKEANAYCYAGTNKANHDVVIIGWDDSYPAENFSIDVGQDGAFICQNSWGPEFGDNGVFYISYYDTNIGLHNAVYTKVEPTDNYDDIYQSDLSGWTGTLGYGRENAYFANMYTAKEDCTLAAVGFYATGPYSKYTVYTTLHTGSGTILSKMEDVSGTLDSAGYYTIELKRPVDLKEGEEFAVIVYIETPNSEMPVAVEYKSEEDNTTDITDGEGYISHDGAHWENTETSQNANICLKAYTKTKERD